MEGARGALVPLNDTHRMIDLMRALALPVLVVSRSSLGTINHTLLTLEALRARFLSVAGVVMVGNKTPIIAPPSNGTDRFPFLEKCPSGSPSTPRASRHGRPRSLTRTAGYSLLQ